jgi:hypothetical protein
LIATAHWKKNRKLKRQNKEMFLNSNWCDIKHEIQDYWQIMAMARTEKHIGFGLFVSLRLLNICESMQQFHITRSGFRQRGQKPCWLKQTWLRICLVNWSKASLYIVENASLTEALVLRGPR